VSGGPDLLVEVPDACAPEAGWHGDWEHQEARLEVLPDQDGHYLTGRCLHWAKNLATPQCWWCRCRTLTRYHQFKDCPEWKPQQKVLWTEVRNETWRE